MKIRYGCVSNSSSSSFILFLPRKPKTVEETHKFIYPNMLGGTVSCDYYDGQSISTMYAARLIFDEINITENSYGKLDKKYGTTNANKLDEIANLFCTVFYYKSDYYYDGLWAYLITKERDNIIKLVDKREAAWKACSDKYHALSIEFHKTHDVKVESKKYNDLFYDFIYKNPEYKKLNKAEQDADDEHSTAVKKITRRLMKKWKKACYFVAVVSFGDRDGVTGGIMEHGNAFDHIKYEKISKH